MIIDTVEFYFADRRHPFLVIDSSFSPDEGELISIKGKTYKVLGRSFSVDQSDTSMRRMRCNLIVEEQA